MALMNVNPTRMELTRLKKKLTVAMRGHKLLKDKRDELMRRFLSMVKETKELRTKMESYVKNANDSIWVARALMDKRMVDTALMIPKQKISIETKTENIMSVDIPEFDIKTKTDNSGDIFSYGYAFTSGDLDDGIDNLQKALPFILELAQKENAIFLMASEIEKTRRRVNALEHVMIPDLRDTIRYITMKLDENERSSQTRLMKVKDMMLQNK